MRYPAVEIHLVDPDLVLAVVDDFSPAAVEDHDDGVRVFFTRAADRDHAATAILGLYPAAQVVSLEVDDEDWARRSQSDLRPVTVGRVTILPDAAPIQLSPVTSNPESPIPGSELVVVIRPSMGFGTGHHATTRLCVAGLQTIDVRGKTVLDVGTGSGVLAIAAVRLGAASAVGIDHDADAIRSAEENLALNPDARHVSFITGDLREISLAPADVVTANLTGALLAAAAPILKSAVRKGGNLVVSGLLEDEEPAVRSALEPLQVAWRGAEQGWVALVANRPPTNPV